MKLDYFGIHGRGAMLRMTLWYCNVEFKDNRLSFEEWGKFKSTFKNGQVPALTLDDGYVANQSNAILRYLGKVYTGRNGECLYPINKDPLLAHTIDRIMEIDEAFYPKFKFNYFQKPGSDEYDKNFTNLIVKALPEYLKQIEE